MKCYRISPTVGLCKGSLRLLGIMSTRGPWSRHQHARQPVWNSSLLGKRLKLSGNVTSTSLLFSLAPRRQVTSVLDHVKSHFYVIFTLHFLCITTDWIPSCSFHKEQRLCLMQTPVFFLTVLKPTRRPTLIWRPVSRRLSPISLIRVRYMSAFRFLLYTSAFSTNLVVCRLIKTFILLVIVSGLPV